jgi:hypothetical protein
LPNEEFCGDSQRCAVAVFTDLQGHQIKEDDTREKCSTHVEMGNANTLSVGNPQGTVFSAACMRWQKKKIHKGLY